MGPQIIWAPAKAASNLAKHGISFEEAATVFRDPLLLVIPDLAHSQEEERWIALGQSERQLLLVVIHTENEMTIRIISAREAQPKERRQYEEQFETR
ncbi:MAG TPA: BrnT family toxin [Terracidiphilus sp.]|nr:BrnT family toxin [Terracidiphilus sp.]